MKGLLKNLSFIFAIVFSIVFVCIGSDVVFAESEEQEPNNTKKTAQVISIGTEYTGAVKDVDGVDDEDFYSFSVKEGVFYKISVYNMKDNSDLKWETMLVHLYKDTNTNYGSTITSGDYNKTSKIFRAAYTGNYYLNFSNTSDTQYSFIIEKYSPVGKKVKDSDSNTYKITSNSKVEFSKLASKKKTSFSFNSNLFFSTIGGYDVLDYYDTEFTITSIGAYAFKGSSIRSINIPKEIKSIGTGAFQNCKKLGTEEWIMGVVICGKKVSIGSKAFNGCKKLGTIRILKSASIKSIKKNAFKGTKKGIRVEVPNVKKYKTILKRAGFSKPKYSKSYM